MVESFYNRLIKRGSKKIDEDTVEITEGSKVLSFVKFCLLCSAYKAGECFFVGLFVQELAVSEARVECFIPQYLQVYCDFSDPSYSSCFLVGLLVHELAVKEATLGCFTPQCLQ